MSSDRRTRSCQLGRGASPSSPRRWGAKHCMVSAQACRDTVVQHTLLTEARLRSMAKLNRSRRTGVKHRCHTVASWTSDATLQSHPHTPAAVLAQESKRTLVRTPEKGAAMCAGGLSKSSNSVGECTTYDKLRLCARSKPAKVNRSMTWKHPQYNGGRAHTHRLTLTHMRVHTCTVRGATTVQYNSVERLPCPTSASRPSEPLFSRHVTCPVNSRLPWLVSTAPPTHQSIQYQQRSPG